MANVRSRLTKFGRVPKALLRDGSISTNAKVIYGLLDECGEYQDVTIPMLAKWSGLSDRTVQRTMAELRSKCWVEVIQNRHPDNPKLALPSTYILNDSPCSSGPISE